MSVLTNHAFHIHTNTSHVLTEIEQAVHSFFPISIEMGAKVRAYDGISVSISKPLAQNINHKSCAFGGSISALAILSGWSLLYLKLNELGIPNQLVIQKSEFNFLRPINSDFVAVASMPSNSSWEKFLRALNRHGRSRISIHSEVKYESGLGGVHNGVYVAERTD